MRILITFYNLHNLGGIINNQEALYAGLRELGHEVTVRCLVWKEKVQSGSADMTHRIKGNMGLMINQWRGWAWREQDKFAYKGRSNLRRWKEYASKFDLIIWQIPVPTKQRENFGNTDWIELYDVPVKQIAYVHDGNLEAGSPHIYMIVDKLHAVSGVHPCAYNSLRHVPLPRALTLSGQTDIADRLALADSSRQERSGWFSLQTFKVWKHVEDIVRAVPYMGDYPKRLAGGEVAFHYMTANEKCKDCFRVQRAYDPDCSESDLGRKIWDVAIEHGMEYLDYIHNHEREEVLHRTKFLIDPSWSHKYAANGDHFNRVVIDGLIGGCAPVARDLGIAHDETGVGEIFRPDLTYLNIPWNAWPGEFAEMINAWHVDDPLINEIVNNGRKNIVPWFDNRLVAQSFVDLAENRPAGFYNYALQQGFNPVGERSSDMQARCDRMMNFYNGIRTKEEPESEDA